MLRRECNYCGESLEGYGKTGCRGGRRPTIPEVNSTLDEVLAGPDFSFSSSNLKEEEEDKLPLQPNFQSGGESGEASIGDTTPMVPEQECKSCGKTYRAQRAMTRHAKQCPVRRSIVRRTIMQPPIRGPTAAQIFATRQERLAWRPMPDTQLGKVKEECPQPALESREDERNDISNNWSKSSRPECMYCGKSCKTNRGRTNHMKACQVRRGLTVRTIPSEVRGPTVDEAMAAKEARGNRRKRQDVTMTYACPEPELQNQETRKRAHGQNSTMFDCAYCGRTFVTHRGMMMHLNHCQVSRGLAPRTIPLRAEEKCPQPGLQNSEERRDCHHCRRNFETHRGLMMHMNHCIVIRRLTRDAESRWATKKARLARRTTSVTTACAEETRPQLGPKREGESGDGTISDNSPRWNRECEFCGKTVTTNRDMTLHYDYCKVRRHDARRKNPLVPQFSPEVNVRVAPHKRLVPHGMDGCSQPQLVSEDETRDATMDGEPQTRTVLAKIWEWDRRSSNFRPGVEPVRPEGVAETEVLVEKRNEWDGILRWQWKVAQEASILYGR
ncbi:hypothetical protein MMC31_007522 [Peltigera leucophlebia]|nr:hypothetical protein [Peltigera leucophlebia]